MNLWLQTKTYPSPGHCIYCGTDGAQTVLHREHIIPESLAGRMLIEGASCIHCEKETHAFEGHVVNHLYGDARAHMGIRRGHRRKWPDKLKVQIIRRSGPDEIYVDLKDQPAIMTVPDFYPPGLASGAERKDDDVRFRSLDYISTQKDFRARIKKIPAGKIVLSPGGMHLNSYGRFLAKIAHCYAVARVGLTFEPFLTNAVLNKRPMYLPYYIGSDVTSAPEPTKRFLHRINLALGSPNPFLIVRLQLFAAFNAPAHTIFVGRATDTTSLATGPVFFI